VWVCVERQWAGSYVVSGGACQRAMKILQRSKANRKSGHKNTGNTDRPKENNKEIREIVGYAGGKVKKVCL